MIEIEIDKDFLIALLRYNFVGRGALALEYICMVCGVKAPESFSNLEEQFVKHMIQILTHPEGEFADRARFSDYELVANEMSANLYREIAFAVACASPKMRKINRRRAADVNWGAYHRGSFGDLKFADIDTSVLHRENGEEESHSEITAEHAAGFSRQGLNPKRKRNTDRCYVKTYPSDESEPEVSQPDGSLDEVLQLAYTKMATELLDLSCYFANEQKQGGASLCAAFFSGAPGNEEVVLTAVGDAGAMVLETSGKYSSIAPRDVGWFARNASSLVSDCYEHTVKADSTVTRWSNKLVMSRVVGDMEKHVNRYHIVRAGLRPYPNIAHVPLDPAQQTLIVLVSNGVANVLKQGEIAQLFMEWLQQSTPADIDNPMLFAKKLCAAAVKRGCYQGKEIGDNATVVCLWSKGQEGMAVVADGHGDPCVVNGLMEKFEQLGRPEPVPEPEPEPESESVPEPSIKLDMMKVYLPEKYTPEGVCRFLEGVLPEPNPAGFWQSVQAPTPEEPVSDPVSVVAHQQQVRPAGRMLSKACCIS